MSASPAGKGDDYRKVDPVKYAKGYDRAMGFCQKHPNYRVEKAPVQDCIKCRILWREKERVNG